MSRRHPVFTRMGCEQTFSYSLISAIVAERRNAGTFIGWCSEGQFRTESPKTPAKSWIGTAIVPLNRLGHNRAPRCGAIRADGCQIRKDDETKSRKSRVTQLFAGRLSSTSSATTIKAVLEHSGLCCQSVQVRTPLQSGDRNVFYCQKDREL